MSQSIGTNLVTKIPQFSDDASIEEALKAYHYGIDNYTSQPIVNNVGVEGTIKKIKEDINANVAAIAGLGSTYVEQVSASATPNIITPQTTTTVPLTIRGTGVQTGNLQQWQNSSSNNLAVIFSDGSLSFKGYISIGIENKSTTTALDLRILNSSHKGVTVKASPSQSANLQEWQNSSGEAVSWIDSDGRIYYRSDELSGGPNPFFLAGL
jgi:hypothetical protein